MLSGDLKGQRVWARNHKIWLTLGDEVGHGAQGRVCIATSEELAGGWAVKIYRVPLDLARVSEMSARIEAFDALWQENPKLFLRYPGGYLIDIVESGGDPVGLWMTRYGQTSDVSVLRDWITSSGLGAEERASLARELARHVDYFHTKGLIIGDLKPENVLVSADQSKASIGLIDMDSFGVIGSVDSVYATDCYCAPEGGAGTRESDRFALGVVILQLLLRGLGPFDQPPVGRGGSEVQALISEGATWLSDPGHPGFEKHRIRPLPEWNPALRTQAQRFIESIKKPALRPSARDWITALTDDAVESIYADAVSVAAKGEPQPTPSAAAARQTKPPKSGVARPSITRRPLDKRKQKSAATQVAVAITALLLFAAGLMVIDRFGDEIWSAIQNVGGLFSSDTLSDTPSSELVEGAKAAVVADAPEESADEAPMQAGDCIALNYWQAGLEPEAELVDHRVDCASEAARLRIVAMEQPKCESNRCWELGTGDLRTRVELIPVPGMCIYSAVRDSEGIFHPAPADCTGALPTLLTREMMENQFEGATDEVRLEECVIESVNQIEGAQCTDTQTRIVYPYSAADGQSALCITSREITG